MRVYHIFSKCEYSSYFSLRQMEDDMSETLTLITVGNGKTGRRLVERMIEAGHAVRIGSRRGEPASDYVRRTAATGIWGGNHA